MINPTTENFPRHRVTGDRRTREKRQKRRKHSNVVGGDAVVRKLSNYLSTGRKALANTSMAAAKSCAVRCRLALARRLVPSSI